MAPSLSTFLLFPLFPSFASAALPFHSKILQPVLKHTNEVTFDPLGVAAVLYNPRAETSAARLYTQPDRAIFRWPHTMMIGGALTPLSVLVEYLTSQFSSIDPAVSMCLKDRISLSIRSTMVFTDLPVSLSNAAMTDILAFKPSRFPENDFAIADVDDSFVQPNLGEPISHRHHPTPLTTLDLLAFLCGLLILTGLVFSVLTGDVWAMTLFITYTFHWIASTIISFHPLVKLQENKIFPDSSTHYCVYQRPQGGTVILKGRKDTLERWARMTWIFDPQPQNYVLHWFWTISGSLASVVSVACMVNMAAYLQLGFLAVLGYSSLAEILATQIARKLQARVQRGGSVAAGAAAEKAAYREPTFVLANRTRTMAIIKATLTCGLDGQMWSKLELLPTREEFKRMLVLLNRLRTADDEMTMQNHITEFKVEAVEEGGNLKVHEKLMGRIAEEAEEAWRDLRVRQQVFS